MTCTLFPKKVILKTLMVKKMLIILDSFTFVSSSLFICEPFKTTSTELIFVHVLHEMSVYLST